jgi:hypothetical protein
MHSLSFPRFVRELKDHPAPGYHTIYGQVDQLTATAWFAQRLVRCPQPYLDFLNDIGSGSFFAGSLVLFSIESPGSLVDIATNRLPENERARFFAIGYDGTTEGCYCLSRAGIDKAVYWHNWGAKSTHAHGADFVQWIENCPEELFSKTVYAGYKKIRDFASVCGVVRERGHFGVRLLHYDQQLVRREQKDLLPRYNRIVCGVRKHQTSRLNKLTFKAVRSGSSVGLDNVEYVTIDLPDFPVGEEITVESWVCDPFNVPFRELVIDYSPEIDLSSPMRVRFAELKEYL